ncbi:class I SAM-dependent methyltransferase [Chloroflexi bacterium TSY]|nr:class I SAM-dependent methyltransferase [Chloroflexi bacterium TSY]
MPIHHDATTLAKIQSYATLANKTIFEVGCGDGRVTRYMADPSTLLVACDPDLTRLTEATRTVSGVHFLAGSGLDLPFPDSTFDLVLFTLSLHHHADSGAALVEAARVSRSDGRILVLEPYDSELTQICNLFNDETDVLAEARAAVDNTPLRIVGSEIFSTEWHCEDKQELTQWLFDYYDCPFDQKLEQQVHYLLGEKLNDTPLVLEDKTIIFCLQA